MSQQAPNQPGTLPTLDTLVNIPRLVTAFYSLHPDPADPAQRVAFGTSGHRGSAFTASFNDDHIAAITQAIVDYRRANNIPARSSSPRTPTRSPSQPSPPRSRSSRPTPSTSWSTTSSPTPPPPRSPTPS